MVKKFISIVFFLLLVATNADEKPMGSLSINGSVPIDSSIVADTLFNSAGFWTTDSSAMQDVELIEALKKGHLSAYREEKNLVLGPLFKIDSIELILIAVIPQLSQQLQAWHGEIASRENYQSIENQIKVALRKNGFAFANWTVLIETNEVEKKVVIRFNLQAGDGYKLGPLVAVGTKTTPMVLQRLSLLRVGETWNETRLAQALARLRRRGYYERVDSIGLARDSIRNLISPLLLLADYRGNRLAGLFGYDNSGSSGDGLTGFIDVHLINMRGSARDLDFNFESRPQLNGRSDRDARLVYFEPTLPSLELGARFEGSIALQDSIYDQVDGQVFLIKDLDFQSQGEIIVGRQWAHDYATNLTSVALTGGIGYLLDVRDQSPFPWRGTRLQLKALGIKRDIGDSAYYFSQLRYRSETWFPLATRWVFRLAVDGGANAPMQSTFQRGDLFQVGGARSLRGYREREFLTDLYGYSDFELQYVAGPGARALLFSSPGLINRLGGDVYWRRVLGYGLGLQLGSADWAVSMTYACNPQRSLDNAFLHLEVENRF